MEGHKTFSWAFLCNSALIRPLASGSGEDARVVTLGRARAKGLSLCGHRGVAIMHSADLSVVLLQGHPYSCW